MTTKQKTNSFSSTCSPDNVSSSQAMSNRSTRMMPIKTPHLHDVLCGRGGMSNNHHGNSIFRSVVSKNRELYRTCPKHHKVVVAKAIVEAVKRQDPPGRFLAKNAKDGMWYEIEYKKAVEKTSQALRERERALTKKGEEEHSDHDDESVSVKGDGAKKTEIKKTKNTATKRIEKKDRTDDDVQSGGPDSCTSNSAVQLSAPILPSAGPMMDATDDGGRIRAKHQSSYHDASVDNKEATTSSKPLQQTKKRKRSSPHITKTESTDDDGDDHDGKRKEGEKIRIPYTPAAALVDALPSSSSILDAGDDDDTESRRETAARFLRNRKGRVDRGRKPPISLPPSTVAVTPPGGLCDVIPTTLEVLKSTAKKQKTKEHEEGDATKIAQLLRTSSTSHSSGGGKVENRPMERYEMNLPEKVSIGDQESSSDQLSMIKLRGDMAEGLDAAAAACTAEEATAHPASGELNGIHVAKVPSHQDESIETEESAPIRKEENAFQRRRSSLLEVLSDYWNRCGGGSSGSRIGDSHSKNYGMPANDDSVDGHHRELLQGHVSADVMDTKSSKRPSALCFFDLFNRGTSHEQPMEDDDESVCEQVFSAEDITSNEKISKLSAGGEQFIKEDEGVSNSKEQDASAGKCALPVYASDWNPSGFDAQKSGKTMIDCHSKVYAEKSASTYAGWRNGTGMRRQSKSFSFIRFLNRGRLLPEEPLDSASELKLMEDPTQVEKELASMRSSFSGFPKLRWLPGSTDHGGTTSFLYSETGPASSTSMPPEATPRATPYSSSPSTSAEERLDTSIDYRYVPSPVEYLRVTSLSSELSSYIDELISPGQTNLLSQLSLCNWKSWSPATALNCEVTSMSNAFVPSCSSRSSWSDLGETAGIDSCAVEQFTNYGGGAAKRPERRRLSLLDDRDETPLETRLRTAGLSS